MRGEERMEGVRILNEISPISVSIGVLSVLSVFGIAALFSAIIIFDKGKRVVPILVSLIPVVISVIIFFAEYTSPMRYEATIDDNVKISEFEEKYKIIERRGDIYVIEESESNDK